MVVILQNIRSFYNVGSIFRTADALGVEKIYLCGITPAPIDRFGRKSERFHKTSLGAEDAVSWEKISQTTRLIQKLKHDGYSIFAIEQHKNSTPYFKVVFRRKNNKVALVFGNEVNGLSKSILNLSDKILEIPMTGEKESLNVAVAFGIVGFSLLYSKSY